MNDGRLFADHIYDSVRSTWEWDRKRNANNDHGQLPPDLSTLASLFDPAFRASMQREEGREVRFSIVRMAAAKPQAGRIFTLKEPLVYSDRTLRKISGAIDPITSAFLVDPQGDGAEPIIWGFGYFGNNFLKNLPVATGYESPWPEDLVISAINPGIVSLARGSTSLGVIEFGAYTGPIPTPMTSMASLGDLFARKTRRIASSPCFSSGNQIAIRHFLRLFPLLEGRDNWNISREPTRSLKIVAVSGCHACPFEPPGVQLFGLEPSFVNGLHAVRECLPVPSRGRCPCHDVEPTGLSSRVLIPINFYGNGPTFNCFRPFLFAKF